MGAVFRPGSLALEHGARDRRAAAPAASWRSSGPRLRKKTTLVYHVMAEAQRRGGILRVHRRRADAIDPRIRTAHRRGHRPAPPSLQPDGRESTALESPSFLIRFRARSTSLRSTPSPALVPKAEIRGRWGMHHVGLQARLMSQALQELAGTLNRTDTICIFTNQLREKIGVMFGNPETTPGGRALQVLRLGATRHPQDRDHQGWRRGDRQPRAGQGRQEQGSAALQGRQSSTSSTAPGSPGRGRCSTSASSGRSSRKAGSYFSFGDERLGQGRQNATAFLTENPDIVQQILVAIQAEAAGGPTYSARLLPSAAALERQVDVADLEAEPEPEPVTVDA